MSPAKRLIRADRPRHWPARTARRAFTLVELVVVLLLAAILLAVLSWNLKRPLNETKLEHALNSLESIDREARSEARRRHNAVLLVLESDRGVARLAAPGGRRADASARRVTLPSGVAIERVLVAGQSAATTIRVPFQPLGQSSNYAVRLRSGGRAAWLAFVGNSGQCVRGLSTDEVERMAASWEN